MSVVSTTTAGTGVTTAAAAKAATSVASKMNADTFLTLLMAQLQNQEPTQPMDSTE